MASKNQKKVTLAYVKKEAARINGTSDEEKNKPVVILLAACILGPNIKKISKFTKYRRSEIEWRSQNLRRNKVWVGGKIYSDYFAKGEGVYSLLLDANVAEGYMNRV